MFSGKPTSVHYWIFLISRAQTAFLNQFTWSHWDFPVFLTANSRFPWVPGFYASWSPLKGKVMNVDILFFQSLFDGRLITISPSSPHPLFSTFLCRSHFSQNRLEREGDYGKNQISLLGYLETRHRREYFKIQIP